MPKAKPTGSGPEPKKRSRAGCRNCKSRKIKCNEEKPRCASCTKLGEDCDYSIKLQWGGRSKKDQDAFAALSAGPSTSGFINHVQPSVPSAASTPPAVPAARTQSSSPAVYQNPPAGPPARSSHNNIDPQLVFLDDSSRLSILASSAASRSAYPESYLSRPRLPVPNNYQSHGSPSDYVFRSPSLTQPPSPYDLSWPEQDRTKRVRLNSADSPQPSLPSLFSRPDLPDSLTNQNSPYEQASPGTASHLAYNSAPTPSTPSSSVTYDSSGVRRLSVNSLLSGPPGDYASPVSFSSRYRGYPKVEPDGSTLYGYDYGSADLDMPKNDDVAAISTRIPAGSAQSPNTPYDGSPSSSKNPAFETGGYYAQPVAIKIPKELEPLPPHLTESPMGLLYFHHFINHTARILVPHDCPDNPLKTTLPQIAVKDPNLLHLLLAYSASHRARLLGHPEPINRIATWLRDVFPDLRRALSSGEPISNATLATAIMLASREIVNPNSFDVHIPWQNHLQIARQMIISRGGLKDMGDSGDRFVNFLARWFAYLDVIGSLSGHRNEVPLSEAYWSFCDDKPEDHGFAIDCFFGFTNCCISLLARVARLAHECDAQRIDGQGNVDASWQPSQETRRAAEELKAELTDSRRHVHRGCRHSRSDKDKDEDENEAEGEEERLDVREMASVNETFHLAGLIHLDRRVLGQASGDEEVQQCVKWVLQALRGVRRGSSAESSLLFPMFTAGCEALDPEDRGSILERLKLVEGLGMTHVRKARQLMEKSWDTGKPWETLVSGEFFG